MREILFRGQIKDIGVWVYGNLIMAGKYCCILPAEENMHPTDYPYLDSELGTIDGCAIPVNPVSVGQFTGLLDMNGNKIYEGDIVKTPMGAYKLVYDHGAYWLYDPLCLSNYNLDFFGSYKREAIEVVGNIHDNPEMLED